MLQLKASRFKKGMSLLVEDNPHVDYFFIIQSGQVVVPTMKGLQTSERMQVLGPGDFVGVISCMAHKRQVESAIAGGDVVVIGVQRSQYAELITANTPIALKIIRTFSKRMKVLNESLMAQTTNRKAAEDPAMIFQIARYYDNDDQHDVAAFAYYQYLKLNKPGQAKEFALKRFSELKKRTKAVYFEPTSDMSRKYPRGTMVFCEFQSGAEMFIIQSGSIKITKVLNGTEVTLAILKAGDMFGEMALLSNDLRSASAIANEECVLLTINKQNFGKMVETQPAMIAKLTTTFAERLWKMQRQILNSQLVGHPLEKMVDRLSIELEAMNYNDTDKEEFQTNFSSADIATMAGLTKKEQAEVLFKFEKTGLVQAIKGKLYIPNCAEVIKQAGFYRKQILKVMSR